MAHRVLHRWVPDCLPSPPYITAAFGVYPLTTLSVGLLPVLSLMFSQAVSAQHCRPPRFCLLYSPTPSPPPRSMASPGNPCSTSVSGSYITPRFSSQGPSHSCRACLTPGFALLFNALFPIRPGTYLVLHKCGGSGAKAGLQLFVWKLIQ